MKGVWSPDGEGGLGGSLSINETPLGGGTD